MGNIKKYDWSLIQKEYNDGLSQRDLCKKYNMALATLDKAAKRGDISFRTQKEGVALSKLLKPHKHSEETKLKISLAAKGHTRCLGKIKSKEAKLIRFMPSL